MVSDLWWNVRTAVSGLEKNNTFACCWTKKVYCVILYQIINIFN